MSTGIKTDTTRTVIKHFDEVVLLIKITKTKLILTKVKIKKSK